jgi:hypothetical protein
VSGVLLWTWGFRVYNKNEVNAVATASAPRDSAGIAAAVRDSLQKVYNATITSLDAHIDSTLYGTDSLRTQLTAKLEEFFRLKEEISVLLKNRGPGNDMPLAKEKIIALQQKLEELRNRNVDVENENKKLSALLEQLNSAGKNNAGLNARKAGFENTLAGSNAGNFTASDMRLSAVMVEAEKEKETTVAQQTEKLVGSFVVKNAAGQFNNTEVMVVVLQPDGRVLKSSAWESGIFNTPEGKKIYSYKLSFDYSRGEAKKLLFSLSADKYQKGNYTMQVYHNGAVIGRMSKTLS